LDISRDVNRDVNRDGNRDGNRDDNSNGNNNIYNSNRNNNNTSPEVSGVFELSFDEEDFAEKINNNLGSPHPPQPRQPLHQPSPNQHSINPPTLLRHRSTADDDNEDILVGSTLGLGGCGAIVKNPDLEIPRQQAYHFHDETFEVTALSSVGGRNYNEDAYVVVPDLIKYWVDSGGTDASEGERAKRR